jgi:hypothetical protein
MNDTVGAFPVARKSLGENMECSPRRQTSISFPTVLKLFRLEDEEEQEKKQIRIQN